MSITSLLSDNYAAMPRSEMAKRMPTVMKQQDAVATTEPVVKTDAVNVSLSPKAIEAMRSNTPPSAPADPAADALKIMQDVIERAGVDIDTHIYFGLQSNIKELSIYLFNNPDVALEIGAELDTAYLRMHDGHTPPADIQFDSNVGNLRGTVNSVLREHGHLPKEVGAKPTYNADAIPEPAQQREEYKSFVEHRFKNTKLTPELESMINPEIWTYTNSFGQEKHQLRDQSFEKMMGIIDRANGLVKRSKLSERHINMGIEHVNFMRNLHAQDVATFQERLVNQDTDFRRYGTWEQVKPVIQSYLEPLGIEIG